MRKSIKKIVRFIEVLPILVPVVFVVFSILVTFLLVVGKLNSLLIVLIGIPAILSTALIIYKRIDLTDRPGESTEKVIFDVLMIIFTLLWVVFCMNYSSQNMYVFRDPAVYTNTAKWVSNNDNLGVNVVNPFGFIGGITSDSPGFSAVSNPEDPRKYPQGLHMLPTVAGVAGRALGDRGILHVNALIGGLAVLSVYAFSRMVSRPRWSALTTIALSLTYPFVYFSRDNYTELLSIMVTFSFLAMLWSIEKKDNRSLWLITGTLLGAGALVRIDGLLILAPTIVYLAFLTYSSEGKIELWRNAKKYALLIGSALTVGVIGWIDLKFLSAHYYSVLASDYYKQVVLICVTITMCIAVLILPKKIKQKINHIYHKNRNLAHVLASIIFIALSAFWGSRSLWLIVRDSSMRDFSTAAIENLQRSLDYTIDPTRNYAEYTANWLVWYMGYVLVALGILGVIVALRKIIFAEQRKLFIFVSLFLASTFVTFFNPNIVPDQIWASRRILVITIPGISIFSAIMLTQISKTRAVNSFMKGLVLTVLSIAIIYEPINASRVILVNRLYVPQLAQVYEICRNLPDNAAVLWAGELGSTSVQVIRNYCDKPAVYTERISRDDLKRAFQNAEKNGYKPVILTEISEVPLLPSGLKTDLISSIKYNELERTLLGPPRKVDIKSKTILIGVIK